MDRLTGFQRSVIIGTLLGDGAMRCKKNPLLEINHGYAQSTYVDWKYAALSNLVATPPKLRVSGTNGRRAYRFTTLSLPELKPFFDLFYAFGRKGVPCLKLTPLALAVWFMDDGSRSRRTVYFNTQQFTEPEQSRLIGMLQSQLSILASLNRDKSYMRVRVSTASVERLKSIIEPHIVPEMRYKLPP